MGVKERVLTCRMIEKMEQQDDYRRKLGMENESTFRGRAIRNYGKVKTEKS